MDEWVNEWWTSCPFNLKQCQEISPPHKSNETNQFPCLPQHIPQGSYPMGNPMTCAEHKYIFIIHSKYFHDSDWLKALV